MWIRALANEARNARPRPERVASFEASHLEVRMFNVGHGEAILLIFPGRRTWLIDGGCTNHPTPNLRLAQLLLGYMQGRDLTLEACVPSHPHIDHAGAMTPILTSGSPSLAPKVTVYRGVDAWNLDRDWLNDYHRAVATMPAAIEDVPLRRAHREVAIGPGVSAHLYAGAGEGPYTSIFMQLRYKSTSLLFTGDAHCTYEAELLHDFGAEDFRADMLKVTHHGSSSGSATAVLDAVKPALAIASTGEDSGHTLEQDTLERVLGPEGKRRVFETLACGDIVVSTDGEPYRGGALYRVEFDGSGAFAQALGATVIPVNQIVRTRTDDPHCG